MEMVKNNTILCHSWEYPSQATSKILALILIFANKITVINEIDYFFIYRFYYSILNVGIVFITWLIIKKVKDKKEAFLIALLCTINPITIKYAKQITGDVPVLFFMLIVVFLSLFYVETTKKRYLFLMSFFSACAMLEKWNGGEICLYIVFVVFVVNPKKIYSFLFDGLISFVAFIFSIIIIAPNIINEFDSLLEGLKFTYIYDGGKDYPVLLEYPNIYFTHLGIISLIITVIGLYSLLKKTSMGQINKKYVIYLFPISCIIAQWLIMTRIAFERWGFGIYWGLIIIFVEGVVYCNKKSKLLRCIGRLSYCLFFICFFSETLMIDCVALSTYKDTRIIGEQIFDEYNIDTENAIGDVFTTLNPGGYREKGRWGIRIPNYTFGENFAYEEDGIPYIHSNYEGGDINYVILGGYYRLYSPNTGYDVVMKYGNKVAEFSESASKLDVFILSNQGLSMWYKTEIDTIRYNLIYIKMAITAKMIGPKFEIYDVTDFNHISP